MLLNIFYPGRSSVQFSHSVVSNSLWPHGLQHARPPCPSPTPGVYPNSCSLSRWCHLTISSSVAPFSSCLQSFASSGSFQMSELFAWGGQSLGVSASISVLPMNTQDWSFRMDWLDLLAVQGTLKSLLQHHSSKASILWCSAFLIVQLSHPYMTTGKTIALTRRTFVGKVMSLLLNMLSKLVITFLPRSKRLLISWLQSPSAVILEPQKTKSATVSSSICHEVMGPDALIWEVIDSDIRAVGMRRNYLLVHVICLGITQSLRWIFCNPWDQKGKHYIH